MNINLNSGYVNVTTFGVSAANLSAFNVDWGDGTYTTSFPHTHQYAKAGDYTVQITGCSALSSTLFTEDVCVSDYFKPAIAITTNPLSSYTGCGATFEVCVSSLEPNMTLHFYASGSDSVPFTDPEGFWDHLNPRWRFLNSDGDAIASVTFSGVPLYNGTTTVAYSACYEFQYVDDMPKTPILFVTLETPYSNSRVYAAVPHSVSALEPDSLCITEDGIRDIYNIQWAGVPIPFVVSFCNSTSDCSNILHYTSGAIVSADVTSICTYLDQPISALNINLTDENCHYTGGYILTSLLVPSTSVASVSTITTLEDCTTTGELNITQKRIPAYNTVITAWATASYGGNVYTLSGQSNPFTIYPFEEFHKFRRFGETEDLGEKLNYFAFTDRMRNHTTLWEYMDAIMGNSLDSLGTKTFFGIDRFVDQHSDLDRCNINSLLDMSEKYDINVDDYALDTPSSVRRILDIASMPLEKIVGTRCVCNTNFANCQNCCGGNVCGLCGFDKRNNVGDLITSTDYVTAGEDILYKEKTGNVYEIVHVKSQGGENVFQVGTLSADYLNERSDICFYRWDKTAQGNPIEAEIDYNSDLTTIAPYLSSAEDWFGDGGIVEELLNYQILRGLGLNS